MDGEVVPPRWEQRCRHWRELTSGLRSHTGVSLPSRRLRLPYCGGRTIPRCILVAISDVLPDELPHQPHYRRGTVHTVSWALAPEADHVVAHSSGGSSEAGNLTTLHAMCNTRKSSLAADALPVVTRRPHDIRWMVCSRAMPILSSRVRLRGVDIPHLTTIEPGYVASVDWLIQDASSRASSDSGCPGVR